MATLHNPWMVNGGWSSGTFSTQEKDKSWRPPWAGQEADYVWVTGMNPDGTSTGKLDPRSRMPIMGDQPGSGVHMLQRTDGSYISPWDDGSVVRRNDNSSGAFGGGTFEYEAGTGKKTRVIMPQDPGYVGGPVLGAAPSPQGGLFGNGVGGTSSASSPSGTMFTDPYTDPTYLSYVNDLTATEEAARATAAQQKGSLQNDLARRVAELRKIMAKNKSATSANARVRGAGKSSQKLRLLANLADDENSQISTYEAEMADRNAALESFLQQQLSGISSNKSQAALAAAQRLEQQQQAKLLSQQQQEFQARMLSEQQRMQQEYLDAMREMTNGAVTGNANPNASGSSGSTGGSGGPVAANYSPPQAVQDRLTQIAFLKAVSAANPQAAYLNSQRIASELAGMGFGLDGRPL